MNYSDAILIVKANYNTQSDLIISSLDPTAIVTLAKLCNQKTNRTFTNATLTRLSAMEPHKQCGYLANPYLEWILGNVLASMQRPAQVITNTKVGPKSKKTNTKVEPEPVVESVIEDEPVVDIFDMF